MLLLFGTCLHLAGDVRRGRKHSRDRLRRSVRDACRRGLCVVAVVAAHALGMATAPGVSASSVGCATGAAADRTDPEAFIHAFIERGVAVLRDKALGREERDAIFRNFIIECFDVEFASQFALGRGLHMASRKQLEEYHRLFREDMLRIGNRLFRGYDDETLEVMRIVPHESGDLFVYTRLTNPESAIRDVDFRLRPHDGGYRIIDVQLEGFSLLSAYRSEFVGRLLKGGVEGVLEMLRQRNAKRGELSS